MSGPGESVFPALDSEMPPLKGRHYFTVGGMTKRELFALVSMHALILRGESSGESSLLSDAVLLADGLLEELRK